MIGFAVVRNVEFLFCGVVMDIINFFSLLGRCSLHCRDEKTTPIHGRVGFNPHDCLRWWWR
jgi:hypothetical protein